MEHHHETEDEARFCDACREVQLIEESMDPEDLMDLRIASIVERYNYGNRSDLKWKKSD